MRLAVVALAVVVSLAISVRTQAQVTPARGSEYCAAKKRHSPAALLRRSPVSNAESQHGFDVLDYRLSLDLYACFLPPYPSSFIGTETLTFRAVSALNMLKLDAVNSSLIVDSVWGAATGFSHLTDVLSIPLDRTYNPGETAQVSIAYRHRDVSDNAFYAGNGMVFTDCEPEGARKWFPCLDRPSDKATVDITAKVPASVKLGSNGRLADSVRTADTIAYRWVSRDPVATYLVVISAKVDYLLDIVHWVPPSDPASPVPIRFYWNPGEAPGVSDIKSKILPMTDLFSELFGEHPFEKNGFATLNADFPWGGMENQTLTSLCPGCWGESLIAHEFAHQWFGDMITCETWADIWLNEGFATYCESLWLEERSGYESYKNDVLINASYYLYNNPGRAIYEPSWAEVTPPPNLLFDYGMTYAKGACVLHMLRYVLGDDLFFHGLRSYATDTAYFKYRTASTDVFVERMNSYTGTDLWWFFNAWLTQPNHPVYAGTYSVSDLGSGWWEVAMRARQSQTDGTFFPMPLTFRVVFSGGQDTVVRVMNDANPQVYAFRFERQPTAVVFDPNKDIVLKGGTWSSGVTAAQVVLAGPQDGESVDGALPPLIWLPATAALTYEIEVAIDSSFTSIVVASPSVADTVFAPAVPLAPGRYHWRVRGSNSGGPGDWSEARSFIVRSATSVDARDLPLVFTLEQNFPNPFNPGTVIGFTVPERATLKLAVYDLLGREVTVLMEGTREAGRYDVTWDASLAPTGIYVYRLRAGSLVMSKKMMLVK